MKQLILGGARSGKSALAEKLALSSGNDVCYIATADVAHNDAEMSARIAHHSKRRPSSWHVVEAPQDLAGCLQEMDAANTCLLVDCLTLWLSNCLLQGGMENWETQRESLLSALPELQAEVIFVSNEVGLGIVPLGEVNRQFVDESGFLHQALASLCDRVVFTAAALPLVLKGLPLDHN